MDEPSGSSIVVSVAKGIVVYGWIWRRQPLPRFLLRFVTCEDSVVTRRYRVTAGRRTLLFIHIACNFLQDYWRPQLVTPHQANKSNVPSAFRMLSSCAFLPNQTKVRHGIHRKCIQAYSPSITSFILLTRRSKSTRLNSSPSS